jgi:hypothetical protein
MFKDRKGHIDASHFRDLGAVESGSIDDNVALDRVSARLAVNSDMPTVALVHNANNLAMALNF